MFGSRRSRRSSTRTPSCAREREPRDRASSARGTRRSPRRRSSDAFTNLVELSEPLARAGEARQDIDLIWGATLTRFVSLATGRLGSQFLSVGRVQSPTLAIVVERELERRAHVAEALLGGVRRVRASRRRSSPRTTRSTSSGRRPRRRPRSRTRRSPGRRQVGRVEAQHAQAAGAVQHDRLHERRVVGRACRRRARCASPRTSTWTGSSPIRAPTTPCTRSRCRCASCCSRSRRCPRSRRRRRSPSARARARRAARRRRPTTRRSTRRRRSTRACCPTTATARSTSWSCAASSRRSPTRRCRSRRAPTSRPGTETYFVRGNVLVEPGFLAVYPYGRSKDEEIPKVEEGQELALADRRRRAAARRRGGRRPGRGRTRGPTRRRRSRRRASARAS